MSRTITSTLVVPRDQALPRAEILDHLPGDDGGIAVVAKALNTLMDHHRAALVNDWSCAGIIHATGQIARYRPKCPIGESWSGETARVWLFVDLQTTGGSITITIRELGSGDSIAYTATSTTYGYVDVGAIDVADDVAYLDFEVEITANTGFTTSTIHSVQIMPNLTRLTLPAAPWGSGTLPIDLAHIGGECPLSVARLVDMHVLAARIASRCGTFVAGSKPAGAIVFPVHVDIPVPACATSVTVWLWTVVSGTTVVTASIDGDSDSIRIAGRWQSITLDLLPTADRDEPRWTTLVLDTSGGAGKVKSISGYLT